MFLCMHVHCLFNFMIVENPFFLLHNFQYTQFWLCNCFVRSKSNCKHFFRTNWFLFSACLNHQHDYIMAHVLSSQTCSKNNEKRRRKSKITTSFYMFYKRLYGKQAHFTFAYSALKLTKTIAKIQKKEIITSNVCK